MADYDDQIRLHREFLKDSVRRSFDFARTDQNRGAPPPPVEKPCAPGAALLRLPAPDGLDAVCGASLLSVLRSRRSVRRYAPTPLSLEEVALLLWATQGITERHGDYATLRPVPSAGGRHPFETYLYAQRVAGVTPGLYRYLPVEHALVLVFEIPEFPRRVAQATFGQRFI
ncbi:MAG: SagB/ThcOx family dehydrogenase, partial [Deltaproteobacteria bacterium]|nr:SagB/ThcOx family dehydrogenase [Deltaproteobacteria bacterium]